MNALSITQTSRWDTLLEGLQQPDPFQAKSTALRAIADEVFLLAGPADRDAKYAVRLERTRERLAQHAITMPQIIAGEPTAQDILDYKMNFQENVEGRFVSGLTHQRGAAFKHLRALERIAENQIGIALICEDDILFHDELQSHLDSFIPRIPRDADIVYLGYSNPIRQFESSLTEPEAGVWKGAFWCLHCYLVTYQGAMKILDALPMFDQIDYFYGRLAAEGRIHAYAPKFLNEKLEASQICAYTARGFCYQEKDVA